jgi:predicted ATPase
MHPCHPAAPARRFIVVTGGPGGGKTTLIDVLGRLGLATAPEAGRAIICEQAAIGGPALPWADTRLFFETILSWEIRSYRQAQVTAGPVFFDRGIPDMAGGYTLLGLDVPAHVRAAIAAFRYHPAVFLAPPWPEIYTTDTERKQSFEEAERTCAAMAVAYQEAGYELIRLPLVPLAERLRSVLSAAARMTAPANGPVLRAISQLRRYGPGGVDDSRRRGRLP